MSAGTPTQPRRGILDRSWVYRRACETDVAATFAAERARLASLQPGAACPTAAADKRPAHRWDFTGTRAAQAGRINTDEAVALIALSLFAAACRFGGVFG